MTATHLLWALGIDHTTGMLIELGAVAITGVTLT